MRSILLAAALGAVAALAAALVLSQRIDLAPGELAFRRLVSGSTPSGRIHRRAVVSLPGLRRSERGELRLEVEATRFRIGLDGAPLLDVRASPGGAVAMELPRSGSAGARLALAPAEGEGALAIRRIAVRPGPAPLWPPALALLATMGAALAAARRGGLRLGAACGLAMAGFTTLAATSSSTWLELGLAAAAPFAFAGASVALGAPSRSYWRAFALLAALVFGFWVRWYFLPSAGSWDTEYWKAWMSRAAAEGVSRVYGGADATPPGSFVAHLLGREELFQIDYRGRKFVVDYPPLAMALWRASWELVRFAAPGLDRGEAENVAVKLPPVLGDLAALVLLLLLYPRRPAIGILYWALPVSWLSSAVLGFLDGAYAPVAALGLVAAGRGKSAASGALLAIAGMIKPQALIVAPAAAAALGDGRAIARAAAAGFGTVALALVPFALAGTLEEAVTHVFRILFQQRLSAGFANPWWLVGHFAGGGGLDDRIGYAAIDSLRFPAAAVGTALFALAAAWVVFAARAGKGFGAACLAGAMLVLAYGMLAMGVHENHPHAMFLAFAASGLATARLRILTGILAASYVLNMLALSGLGRFYGLRFMALEPFAAAVGGLRMSPGFDLTVLLAIANGVVFVWLLLTWGSPIPAETDRSR